MKGILAIIFLFSSVLSFSQEEKHSVGISVCPFEFIRWHHLKTNPYWYKNPESERTISITNSSPFGINYQYMINNSLKVQAGISYTIESKRFSTRSYSVQTGQTSTDTDYKLTYCGIPVALRFFPEHLFRKDALGGLFIQAGGCFDFRTTENITSTTRTSSSYPGAPYSYLLDSNYKKENINSNQIKLNRIYPAVGIGQEVVGDYLVFFYSCKIKFESIYLEENALFSAENIKLSIFNVGLSYRF